MSLELHGSGSYCIIKVDLLDAMWLLSLKGKINVTKCDQIWWIEITKTL